MVTEQDFGNPFDIQQEPEIKIDEFLENLKNEIKETKDAKLEVEQLVRLKEIASIYNGEDKVVSFDEIAEDIKNSPPPPKMPSSVGKLDELFHGGFMTQTVTTISATPKSGKTSFCMFLTTKFKEQNPLWFALEENTKTLIRKMIKNGNEVPHGYAPAKKKTVTVKWIETKVIESIVKFGTKVVFIDQLDFIVPQDNQGDRHDLKIAKTMRDLHDMAVKWDVAIFLICHLNQIEPDVKPTTRNLRGSTSIWGEADNCIFLWRECKRENGNIIYTNNVELSVQANREDGDTGVVGLVFDKGQFREFEWQTKDEQMENDFNQKTF